MTTNAAEELIAWSQLQEATRALDAAWPSLPPSESEEALRLRDEVLQLLAAAEERLYPRLGLDPPDRGIAADARPPRPLP